MTNPPDLVGFCQAIMTYWPDGGVDGGELQDLATQFGLLGPEERTDFCDTITDGESDGTCPCRELVDSVDAAQGFTCYRRVPLTASPDAALTSLSACRALRKAYLAGGSRGGSMDWSEVDQVMAIASDALKANGEDHKTEAGGA